MQILERFKLAADVVIIPYDRLGQRERVRINCGPSDSVISRRGGRANSKVLSDGAVGLLAEFAELTSVVDAVSRFASGLGKGPDTILVEAFPLIRDLVNQGFLVAEAEAEEEKEEPADRFMAPGRSFAGYKIAECIQGYEDVAVYRAKDENGSTVALKVAVTDTDRETARRLQREADLLTLIGGRPAPRLIEVGMCEGRAFLVMEWIKGEPVTVHADRLRLTPDGGREPLLELCRATVEAFAALHRHGVVHGDIHSKNILVEADGSVAVIDYGLARAPAGPRRLASARRGGVEFFFEPEYAQSRLQGGRVPSATFASDQYGIGCILFLTITGKSYIDFSFEKSRTRAQIAADPPRRFAECGVFGLDAVEQAVATILAKKKADRFASLEAADEALGRAIEADRRASPPASASASAKGGAASSESASLDLFVREVVDGVLAFDPAQLDRVPINPKCSLHSGATGIAYFLYRIACNEDDASLLAAADRWSHAALRHIDDPDAYFCEADSVTPATVGHASLFHSAVGTHFVQALISQAMGDFVKAGDSVAGFVAASGRTDENLDYFMGRAGHLEACATLRAVLDDKASFLSLAPLDRLGDQIHDELEQDLGKRAAIGEDAFRKLGAAHGWTGALYALMGWRKLRGRLPGRDIARRMGELEAIAVETEHGITWPVSVPRPERRGRSDFMTGWCNGTAGHLQVWSRFDELTGGKRAIVERIADEVIAAGKGERTAFLCCGTGGAAYALLARYGATGDLRLLDAARALAERSLGGIRSPSLPFLSLYRGRLGIAALASDLRRPKSASMPMFGPEHLG